MQAATLKLPRRPSKPTPTQKVNVQMKDRLSGTWPNVENSAISILNAALARNIGGHEMTAANQFCIVRARLL